MNQLEAESIEILREAVATARNPVMMYSIGKDSSVMLHLARKAFHPAPPPFPLLHVDTRWKFRDMYAHRDRMAAESGMRLIVHTNAEGVAAVDVSGPGRGGAELLGQPHPLYGRLEALAGRYEAARRHGPTLAAPGAQLPAEPSGRSRPPVTW